MVNHQLCYSIYKRKNFILHGETTKKRKNIANLSWAQFLWQFDNDREDVVPGLCLFFIDLCNVSYKETCELEDRYENEIHIFIQSLSKKPPDNPESLAQPCSVLEGYFQKVWIQSMMLAMLFLILVMQIPRIYPISLLGQLGQKIFNTHNQVYILFMYVLFLYQICIYICK